jgi:hypothetical protein
MRRALREMTSRRATDNHMPALTYNRKGRDMAKAPSTISLPKFKLVDTTFHIIGTAPLLAHAFPEKARKMMLDKQMKVAQGGRDARDPCSEFAAARYILPDGGDGFPSVALKDSAVTACTSLSDVTKVSARQAFRVKGVSMNSSGCLEGSFVRTSLIPLIAHEPVMREDVVRLSGIGRTPEMRYRPEYFPWGMQFDVQINEQIISIGQLFTMFEAAGHGVGIGDYRPERDGDCGTFRVASHDEFKAWRAENGLNL